MHGPNAGPIRVYNTWTSQDHNTSVINQPIRGHDTRVINQPIRGHDTRVINQPISEHDLQSFADKNVKKKKRQELHIKQDLKTILLLQSIEILKL